MLVDSFHSTTLSTYAVMRSSVQASSNASQSLSLPPPPPSLSLSLSLSSVPTFWVGHRTSCISREKQSFHFLLEKRTYTFLACICGDFSWETFAGSSSRIKELKNRAEMDYTWFFRALISLFHVLLSMWTSQKSLYVEGSLWQMRCIHNTLCKISTVPRSQLCKASVTSHKRSKDLGALLDSCSWDDIGNNLEDLHQKLTAAD